MCWSPSSRSRSSRATARPRPGGRRSGLNPRYIPAHVKRTVWERDQGQCTFLGDTGRRCESRKFLEYDHVDPVACGGQATVQGLRLRCGGHNQLEAERTFGAGFMSAKREDARRAAAHTWVAAQARAHAEPQRTELEPGAHARVAEAAFATSTSCRAPAPRLRPHAPAARSLASKWGCSGTLFSWQCLQARPRHDHGSGSSGSGT